MLIDYQASPTLSNFHRSNAFVRAILGPIGSGKSVSCVAELHRRACEQAPDAQGKRKTRWVIIRNTYRELIDTALVTFFTWIPKSLGHYSVQHLSFRLNTLLEDGTTVEAEFLFRALDRPDDIKKLLSLDLTGAWINEAREVPKAVFEMAQGRCGRYPAMKDGGPTWHGVILDTNPPDNDHWWFSLFEENRPDNYRLFKQPSGISEEAENIKNLPAGYYTNITGGKTKEWINVYVHGLYGYSVEGNPVFNEYKDDIHSSVEGFVPDLTLPIYVGIDFGLTPAAVVGQLTSSGRMVIFDELITFDMGAMTFGKLLKEKLNKYGVKANFEVYADPAGNQRAQTDEVTPFMILNHQGINAFPTYTNDFTIRREAVADFMMRLDFAGHPAFLVTQGAPTLRKGLAGGYKYKRLNVSGEERYHDVPDKGKFSHCCDALQYLMLGAVGGGRVIGGFDNSKPLDYSNISIGII